MTEAELAEYFYAHRDDLAGEEVPSRTPERMDVMISARFTPSEAVELRAAAEQARMSVSAFLRQRVMATLHTNVVNLERARADLKDVYTKDDMRIGYRRGGVRWGLPSSDASLA
jgi:hypothetical protein